MWSQTLLAPLHTSGFPTVTLCVLPSTHETEFCLHLIEYNGWGYGRRLVRKYVRARRTETETPIMVRLPMIATKIALGHRLVLSVTNYQDQSFHCVPRPDVATILFKTISLPYLFDY